MKEIVLSNYTWHPLEERVWAKHVYFNGTLNETSFYISETFMQVVNASGSYNLTYVYQQKDLIGFSENTNKNWNLLDHKGSSIGIMNRSGSVIETTQYEPYGKILSGGATSKLDYEGEENDPTTGMIDFDARMVDPELGMFMQPDSIISSIYNPQTLNHYAFENNNPYKYTDEDGKNPVLVYFVIGVVIPTLIEVGLQTYYAGDIYSQSRVIETFTNSLITGLVVGELFVAGNIPAGVGVAIDVLNYPAQIKESSEEAKKHKGFYLKNAQKVQEKLSDIFINQPGNTGNSFLQVSTITNPSLTLSSSQTSTGGSPSSSSGGGSGGGSSGGGSGGSYSSYMKTKEGQQAYNVMKQKIERQVSAARARRGR